MKRTVHGGNNLFIGSVENMKSVSLKPCSAPLFIEKTENTEIMEGMQLLWLSDCNIIWWAGLKINRPHVSQAVVYPCQV